MGTYFLSLYPSYHFEIPQLNVIGVPAPEKFQITHLADNSNAKKEIPFS